jgi:hypothetical protein
LQVLLLRNQKYGRNEKHRPVRRLVGRILHLLHAHLADKTGDHAVCIT